MSAEVEPFRLQWIVDRRALGADGDARLRAALDGGVDLIQVREKGATTVEVVAFARRVLAVTSERRVPLLVNDDVDAACALGAEVAGVHLGQEDLPVAQARLRLGPAAWIGLSTHSAEELVRGLATTATHFGLGACFATATKVDHRVLARAELARACALATRPLFAIGGITPANVAELVACGVRRIAVSQAISGARDPAAAAAALRRALTAADPRA